VTTLITAAKETMINQADGRGSSKQCNVKHSVRDRNYVSVSVQRRIKFLNGVLVSRLFKTYLPNRR